MPTRCGLSRWRGSLAAAGALVLSIGCDSGYNLVFLNQRQEPVIVTFAERRAQVQWGPFAIEPCARRETGVIILDFGGEIDVIVRSTQEQVVAALRRALPRGEPFEVQIDIPGEPGNPCPQPLREMPTPPAYYGTPGYYPTPLR